MSNLAFDFLADSKLFYQNYLDNDYASLTEKEIQYELAKYREHIIKQTNAIQEEMTGDKTSLKVSMESFDEMPSEDMLKQVALYVDKIVIADPIFKLTTPKRHLDEVMSKFNEMENNSVINRKQLKFYASYMKKYTFLVANQFIKYAPVSQLHEAPDNLPIYYSQDDFKDSLPKPIYQYFYDKAKIYNVKKLQNLMTTDKSNSLEIGRIINIDFEGDIRNGLIYQLMETKIVDFDKETGKFLSRTHVPSQLPSKEEFEQWIYNSINKASIRRFSETFNELIFANQVESMYLTKSQFTADLLSVGFDSNEKFNSDLANLAMNINIPVAQNISLETLIDIKTKEGTAFQNFRCELQSKLRELRGVTDKDIFKMKLDNILHELTEVQVRDVNKEYRKIIRSLGIDTLFLIGTLIPSYFLSGMGSLGATAATVSGTFSFSDYLKKINNYSKNYFDVKENKGYFMWKLSRKAHK